MRLLIATLVGASAVARADPAVDQDRALERDPDPARPTFELGWRNGLRGEAGEHIPLVRRDDRLGFGLDLLGFIELHNDGPGVVPYQLWRGHLGLVAAERWLAGAWTLRAFGALEHESDHDIDSHWIYWEGAALGLAATHASAGVQLTAIGSARFLFETCTTSVACTEQVGRGDVSVQATASLVADLSPHERAHPFAAVYADATPGHGEVAFEVRAIAHAGYALDAGLRGTWQVFAAVLVGREVGLDSLLGNQLRYGIGVRWMP
jgi:hypothetical protein